MSLAQELRRTKDTISQIDVYQGKHGSDLISDQTLN